MRKSLLISLLVVAGQQAQAGGGGFFQPSDSLNKVRLYSVVGGSALTFSGIMVGLNYLWYDDYPRSNFHLFNDSKEWQQIDKAGHMQSAYFESIWMMRMLQWSGLEDKKAIWYGGLSGFVMQTSIEVLDGMSEKWGASPMDIAFNGLGSMAAISQELAWGEQRISLKYSTHAVQHPSGILTERAEQLYGDNLGERLLKDYNGQVYWASFNLASFFPKQQRAKWLNVALGYGAGGMYSGFENIWEKEGEEFDYSHVKRYRQFFISLDADLTKIPVKSKGVGTLLGILNIIKLPAPALEINTKGQVIFHPMYFLNWDVPLYLKK